MRVDLFLNNLLFLWIFNLSSCFVSAKPFLKRVPQLIKENFHLRGGEMFFRSQYRVFQKYVGSLLQTLFLAGKVFILYRPEFTTLTVSSPGFVCKKQ